MLAVAVVVSSGVFWLLLDSFSPVEVDDLELDLRLRKDRKPIKITLLLLLIEEDFLLLLLLVALLLLLVLLVRIIEMNGWVVMFVVCRWDFLGCLFLWHFRAMTCCSLAPGEPNVAQKMLCESTQLGINTTLRSCFAGLTWSHLHNCRY